MKKLFFAFILINFCQFLAAQNNSGIKGNLSDIQHIPIHEVTIYVDGHKVPNTINKDGLFEIKGLSEGHHKIKFVSPDFKSHTEIIELQASEIKELNIILYTKGDLEQVEIYGYEKQPTGLDAITRLPLNPRDMSQTISIIPEQLIKEQGIQTITDATRNVPGVTLFSSYGGVKESMSIRGYRGVPVLKNGIQVDSDFRTASLLSDMQGVENIQVLKGSAAITQGIGNGLGSPGGVINVVTKIPQFTEKGNVSIKTGSWGLFRPVFDYQAILDKKQTAAFRLNGVYQRADSYKSRVTNNRIYVNPSFEWRPDDKTRITLEMDYLNDNTTPDRGTINLGPDTEDHLYDLPHSKFFGWGTDNVNTKTTTYMAKIVRNLNNNLSLRAVYAGSNNEVENIGLGSIIKPYEEKDNNGKVILTDYYRRTRYLTKSESEDKGNIIQLDLIGKDIYTGKIKHTFQTGFDYKATDKKTISYESKKIDVIEVLNTIPNNLPQPLSKYTLKQTGTVYSKSGIYGLMAQDAITINKYLRATLALRYSQNSKKVNAEAANEAWDPFIGLMVTPVKNISVFGNYATTTDLRSANNPTPDGSTLGPSVSRQLEVGLKSDWLNNKLTFNATYFHIKNNDLSYQIFNNGKGTGLYEFAGDIVRKGIDLELTGKIASNLQVILGYSYLDAKYKDSPAYHNDSRPSNTPYDTANGWVRYLFDQGFLKNLSVGVGVYYIGNRPINDYSVAGADPHGNNYPKAPFNMPAYTTVNAQLGYNYQNMGLQVFFNNIFDEIGYSSYYRGGYVNQIDPRNFGVQLSYNF